MDGSKENPVGKWRERGALASERKICAAEVKHHIALECKCNGMCIQKLPAFRRSVKDCLSVQCSKINAWYASSTKKFDGLVCM
jgi:hypothetical protein